MLITVCPTRYQPTPASEHWATRSTDAEPCSFQEAMDRAWPTDAHFTAYAPFCPPALDGKAVRLESDALGDGVTARMVALVGDVDDPVAHATKAEAREAWRSVVEPRIRAAGLGFYQTRGGYRVLAALKEPCDLKTPDDARAWRALYLGWCNELRDRHQIDLDRACADWTRLYRLPNVVRDGHGVQRAMLSGRGLPIVDAYAIEAEPMAESTGETGAEERELTDQEFADLDAVAEELAPHFELGHRHMIALGLGGWLRSQGMPPSAARYVLAGLSSEDPEARVKDALKAWSVEGSVMGWSVLRDHVPSDALERIAAIDVRPSFTKSVIAKQLAKAEARAERRQAERLEREAEAAKPAPADFSALGTILDLASEPKPLAYICREFGFAPGKVSTIAGYAGAGKGPLLGLYCICCAAGIPFLGAKVEQVRTVLWDCETGPLLHERLWRIANALRVDLGALMREGWLVVIDGRPPFSSANLETLKALATGGKVSQFAIDSFTSATLGVDQNASNFADLAWLLGDLSKETGCAVLCTVHDRKATSSKGAGSDFENQSGHNSLQGAQQASVRIVRPNQDDPFLVELRCARHPGGGFSPKRVRWVDVEQDGRIRSTPEEDYKRLHWGLGVVLEEATAEEISASTTISSEDRECVRTIVRYLELATSGSLSKVSDHSSPQKRARALIPRLTAEGVLLAEKTGVKIKGEDVVHFRLAPPTKANAEARARWLM